MEDTNRIIPLDDKLLLSMVIEKGELVEKGRAISKQMEELANQSERLEGDMTTLMATVNKKKLDIMRRVEKLAKKELAEFEIPVTTEIRDGKVVLLVTDALSEFRGSFKNFDKWREPVPRKEKKST